MQACLELERETCSNCVETYFKRYMRNYGYVIDYLTRKRLLPIRGYNPRDWFKYSFLMPTYEPQVMKQLSEWVDDLIDRGVPPDKIVLRGKWVFDIKKWNGNRWVRVFHKDPVLHSGMPYWVGFSQITQASVPACCPGSPPGSCGSWSLCGTCGVNNPVAGIALDTGVNPPSGFQAIVGNNCCYSAAGYNVSSPTFSYSVNTNSSKTQVILAWTGSGSLTTSITANYMDFLMNGSTGCTNCGVFIQSCATGCCNANFNGPSGGCGCSSGYYTDLDIELIYENIGSTSISKGTSISLSIQLIIQLSSVF